MAGKKFSRLSILLEAKDKMSGPLNKAANASAKLQNKVDSLDKEFKKSRNGMVSAAKSTRLLADKYRELGQRLGVTDGKVKKSTELFRKLPQPIKNAAYSLEGWAKAVSHTYRNSMILSAGGKAVSYTFKTIQFHAKNMANSIAAAGNKMLNFAKNTKVFSFLKTSIGLSRVAAHLLNIEFTKMMKNSKVWKVMESGVKKVRSNLQAAYLASKLFDTSLGKIAKNSRVFKTLSKAVDGTKSKLRTGYLALKLWQNSSKSIERVKNGFSKVTSALSRLVPKLSTASKAAKTTDSNLGKLGRRRATFNQLADANAKLNREVAKLNSQLSRADSKLGKMKSSLGGMNMVGGAFAAAYAGQAAYGASKGAVQGTVGTAMDQQYSQESVGILAGAKNGAKYYKQIQDYAASTAYSAEDWAKNMRGAIARSKNVKDLEKYQMAMEQLATLDPVQGLDGAALAIRELNSGDITSLVERFELPRSALKEIKGIKDPLKQIDEMMKIVGKSTGYTTQAISKMKELPLMQWQKMQNVVKTLFGYMGKGALTAISPLIEKFNQLYDSGKFDAFVANMSAKFGAFAEWIISIGSKIAQGFSTGAIQEKLAPLTTLFDNIKNSLVEAWPQIQSVFGSFWSIITQVAGYLNANWPQINAVLQQTIGIVASIFTWIANNWSTLAPIIAGVYAGMMVFRGLTVLVPIVMGVVNVIKQLRTATTLARVAFILFNGAMLANPIGLVIAAIAALVAIGVVLYLKWDVIKAKTIELWDSFKKGHPAIAGIIEKIGEMIGVVINACSSWDNFAAAASGAWESIKSAASNAANSVIDSVNTITSYINKIPLINIPKIPNIGGGKGKGHHGGLERVPYDGYVARLHKGERVQTASEVKQEKRGGGNSGVMITGNTFHVRQESDIDAIAEALFRKLNSATMG